MSEEEIKKDQQTEEVSEQVVAISSDPEQNKVRLGQVREEIKKVRNEFFELKKEKEGLYDKGVARTKEIDEFYKEVKQIEEESKLDEINKQLEDYLEREKKIKAEIEQYSEKAEVETGEKGIYGMRRLNVPKVKKQIEAMEHKLQVEVLNLEKESEIIALIKELKDKIKHSGEENNGEERSQPARRKVQLLKNDLGNVERRIRGIYKQIRLVSKAKKKKYRKIDVLREERKEFYDEFKKKKDAYKDIVDKLKVLFQEEEALAKALGEESTGKKKSQNMRKGRKIDEKEIKQAIEKEGKLTTEDLLKLQGQMR